MKKLLYFIVLCTMTFGLTNCSKNGSTSRGEEPTSKGTIQLLNTTNDPYYVTINGNTSLSFTQQGNTSVKKEVEVGYYNIKVKQQSGYLFYPTEKEWSGNVKAGQSQIISY